MIGRIVSHYEIAERLGGGGMGVVYRAHDLKLDRSIALKFLPPELTADPEAKQRFIHEARAASALQHTNICVVHDIDETDEGQLFIVMEYYQGDTLKKKIGGRPLNVGEAVSIAIQIAQGLTRAHAQGIVHRDIKPANIMITTDGISKIVDFGVAKLSRLALVTRSGTTLGTVSYMSPEQARGEAVDQRTDIWSLGVVLYEMLTGKLPFEGEYEAGVVYSIVNCDPVDIFSRRPEIPRSLGAIVARALTKQAEKRYQQCQEMIADLTPLAPGSAPPSSTTPPDRTTRRARIRRAVTWALPPIAAAIAVGAYLLVRGMITPSVPVEAGSIRQVTSIAVLPFDDLSPNRDQEFFCSGIAEEIRTGLSRIPDLKVVGGTSAAALKRKQMEIREIGRGLGVASVLEGSVRKDAGHIRIRLQLSDVADGFTRWSETYDREMKDIFTIQEDISRSVAATLKIALAPETAGLPHSPLTKSPDAFECLLKGNHFVKLYLVSYQEQDFQSALRMYEKAVALDSACAMAYGGIAWAYEHHSLYSRYTGAKNARSDREQSFRYIQRAYQLDPNSGPIVAGMGYVAAGAGEFDRAYEFMRKAIALEPHSLYVNHLVGEFALTTGLCSLATKPFGRAIELDPLYLLSLGEMAVCLERMGEFDNAGEFYRRTLELSPDDIVYKADYIRLLIKTGQLPEAEKLLATGRGITPEPDDLALSRALLLASRGLKQEALKAKRDPSVYAVLGAKEEALTMLEASLASRKGCLYLDLLHDPLYANLRAEARFQALLEKQKRLYDERLAKYGGL